MVRAQVCAQDSGQGGGAGMAWGAWGGRLGPPVSFLVEGQPQAPGRKVVGGSVAVWAPGHGWARCPGGRKEGSTQDPGCPAHLPVSLGRGWLHKRQGPRHVYGEAGATCVQVGRGHITCVQVRQGPHWVYGEAGATCVQVGQGPHRVYGDAGATSHVCRWGRGHVTCVQVMQGPRHVCAGGAGATHVQVRQGPRCACAGEAEATSRVCR